MAASWIPQAKDKKIAPKHIAWEYVSLLAAALQIAKGYSPPINHEAQEALLLHVRNLADFFYQGVSSFKQDPSGTPARDPNFDDIYAVDLCCTVLWEEKPFGPKTKLRTAINKTLSHLSYSRDLASGISAFDGCKHAHGTVRLIRRTWDKFVESIQTQYVPDLEQWLRRHADDKDGLKVRLDDFDDQFEKLVKQWPEWQLNQTPDGRC
jgi:hypothetical protein